MLLLAAMLSTLREREKKNEVRPDPDLDAFMKAQATEGKSGSVDSELVLLLLGLQVTVWPSICVLCFQLFNPKHLYWVK